jgi:hypothetical protein
MKCCCFKNSPNRKKLYFLFLTIYTKNNKNNNINKN